MASAPQLSSRGGKDAERKAALSTHCTFGSDDVSNLCHVFETLLSMVRSHLLQTLGSSTQNFLLVAAHLCPANHCTAICAVKVDYDAE